MLSLLFTGVGLLTAQIQKVTGVVISEEDGLPVIGASVVVKGTTLGTITGVDGDFVINNLPGSAKTLVISYIGMETQEVPVKSQVKVVMKNNSEVLDEVMVVAYGTAKRSAFTGSATVVGSDKIENIQSSNATTALQGKVAGVQMHTTSGQPGASNPSINVRGIGSINAGTEPLIVVDGVPYDGDLNTINNQDIESMTVLKDAASNALYGARGANGVILITTKKGKQGDAVVTVDVKWGANRKGIPEYNTIKDPGQYYEVYYGALRNYFAGQGKTDEEAWQMAVSHLTSNSAYGLGYNVFSLPEGQYLIGRNGKLNPNARLGNVVNYNGQEYLLTPDNWYDAAYKTGLRQEYNTSISAGTERSSFYASFNYLDNEGITKNSQFNRLTGRLKADYQAKDWLKVSANMSYTHYESQLMSGDGESGSSGSTLAFASAIAPIYPLYIRDGQGNIMQDEYGFNRYDYGDGKNAGSIRPFLNNANAYQDLDLNKNESEGNSFSATGTVEIRFLKDFRFTSVNTVDIDETRGTGTVNPFYGQYATQNGIVSKAHNRATNYTLQQLLNWKHTYGKHNVDVLLGHEYYVSQFYMLSGSKNNLLLPGGDELDGAITDGSPSSYRTKYNVEGYLSRMQYDYENRYFVSASFRRDATSRFHKDSRWGNFWSASAAWNMHQEEWFNLPFMDELKLKLSYGEQGNDNVGNFRYTNTFTFVNGDGHAGTSPGGTMGNKDLTWETTGNFNAGVEFSFFKHRLSGGIEFFTRKTKDMLFTVSNAPSFGYTSQYANIGDMKNTGVELELFGNLLSYRGFEWNVNLNVTHYKNKIAKLDDSHKSMLVDGVKGFASGNVFYGEGISSLTYYLPHYVGVNEDGLPLFLKNVTDSDNNIIGTTTTTDFSAASQYLCDTALPDVYGGFGTQLSYKGIDFSADFAYQIGGKAMDSDYMSYMSAPTSNGGIGYTYHADVLRSWTADNSGSNIPRFQFGDQFTGATSDRFLTSSSYLSLQNITLGYTLPAKCLRSLSISKLRVYATAENVWVWSKRQGFDPRQGLGGSNAAAYAPIRTITGGITLQF